MFETSQNKFLGSIIQGLEGKKVIDFFFMDNVMAQGILDYTNERDVG